MLGFETAILEHQLSQSAETELYNHIRRVAHKWPELYDIWGIELLLEVLCMTQKEQSFIELLGKLTAKTQDVDMSIDLLLSMSEHDLINIDVQGKKISVICVYEFDIPEVDKHVVLSKNVIEPVTVNDYEYGHAILGGYLKQNRYNGLVNICLDHLDRLNNIKLSLNITLMNNRVMQPSDKQIGTPEWKEFKRCLYKHYQDIVFAHENKFNIIHKYDNRGRCYTNSYYANYQGNDFQKAVIQLINKEIVTL